MWQAEVRGYYGAEILYIFLSTLTLSNEKTQNYKVVDLIKFYNFHIKINFIWYRIKELWFFKNLVLSRHPRWRNKTIRDKLFESASSPLWVLGELNDNIIKGLISLLSVEQDNESITYTCGLCINKYMQGSTNRQTWWYAT